MSSSSPPPPSPTVSSATSVSSASQPAVPKRSALESVHALLRELLRVTTSDGRVFIGTFAGTDKPLNIILINAEEYRVGPGQDPDGRYVGQIMLPWKICVKVEAHVKSPQSSSRSLIEMYM